MLCDFPRDCWLSCRERWKIGKGGEPMWWCLCMWCLVRPPFLSMLLDKLSSAIILSLTSINFDQTFICRPATDPSRSASLKHQYCVMWFFHFLAHTLQKRCSSVLLLRQAQIKILPGRKNYIMFTLTIWLFKTQLLFMYRTKIICQYLDHVVAKLWLIVEGCWKS